MRIAYLMLVHKEADQVNRLLDALDDPAVDFFVHVDRASTIERRLKRAENIFYLGEEQRVRVHWGELSQVEATRAVMEAALDSKRDYDYLWLISGQDYPLRSNQEILDYLAAHAGRNFFNIMDLADPLYPSFRKRNEIHHPRWLLGPSFMVRALHRLYGIVTGGRNYTFGVFRRRPPVLKDAHGIAHHPQVYFGASWFTVTAECARYIVDTLAREHEYYLTFQGSLMPDECCIQTLVMNSGFRDSVADYLCYVDWSAQKRNPKILVKDDLEALLRSPYLIARKFDCGVDEDVLDLLDRWIERSIEPRPSEFSDRAIA